MCPKVCTYLNFQIRSTYLHISFAPQILLELFEVLNLMEETFETVNAMTMIFVSDACLQ